MTDRKQIELVLSGKSVRQIRYRAHARAKVYRDVKELVEQIASSDHFIYGYIDGELWNMMAARKTIRSWFRPDVRVTPSFEISLSHSGRYVKFSLRKQS